ncbi:MAG: MBL fold metallo-hydrolase [Candidatus Aminicenantes bacterium]|nr:MBL fold metallo-hydrolase [Candidatus Aminicenantes bacterium]
MSTRSSIQAHIVYDNNPYDERLKTDWGLSCFVEGLNKSILFDTGTKGRILLSNMKTLGIQPEKIDVVVLSHAHGDHSGGLEDLLSLNPKIEVWLHNHFSSDFRERIRKKAANVIEVEGSQKICEGAYTSGVINGWIKEQSLVLDTEDGLSLITGCAHPRIVNVISRVTELFKKEITLAMGGFHLGGFERLEIKEIINRFRDFKVQKVGPCHCSGNDARRLFQEEYQNDFLEIGVGKEITIQ